LAVRYLKAYTSELNYNCEVMEFSINDRLERIVQEIYYKKPDIVAFSCYIWNMQFVEQVSKLLKLIDNNIKILYGGPEVSYNSSEVLKNSLADYLIEGEGEETYGEFIQAMIEGKSLNTVRGLYLKDGDNISYGGRRELMDMNRLVFPYTEDEDLNNKIVYYEASRGCPFGCKYCLSSTIRGVRFMDIKKVEKELKFLIDKKVRLVKFVDRTFNCSVDFSMAIWDYLIKQDTDTTFHFEISANILTDKQLELLAAAPKGRFQFEVGVQTTNDQVLRNINRFISFKDVKKQMLEVKKLESIMQHLDLIAGLPGEDYASFKTSFNELYSIEPDEIQLGFLKVLKGSPMEAEAEKWGIVYSPYTPYEVLKTDNISYDELLMLKRVEEMVDKYYNSQKFSSIIKYLLPSFETPFDFYFSLGTFFYEKGYFNRNIASPDYYKVFLEFNNEVLKRDNTFLREIVKFEYLKYNKKKWLPEFLHRDINKNLERDLKEAAKKKHINIPFESWHLESFTIDITEYLKTGLQKEGNYYLIFDEKGVKNILDVTKFINEENILR
jgi:radical SAM superfamily enzyme YgiQ (UPF0313 family)